MQTPPVLIAPVLIALAVVALLAAAPQVAVAQPTDAQAVSIITFQVDLRPQNASETRVGRLRYLGGLVLRSEDRRFSGLSSLHFVSDDDVLLAVSDRGFWVSFRPLFEGENLIGVAEGSLWPILAQDGRPVTEPAYDAESLTLVGDTAYVGFERLHRVDAFAEPLSGDNPPAEQFRGADTFGERAYNGGLEGMTALDATHLLAIAEDANDDGTMDGWIMDRRTGETRSLALLATPPFSLTDLATLPNGDVITLERSFSVLGRVGARLRLIERETIAAHSLLDGEVLAELGSGFNIDNMEGLAIRTRDGRTELFLISDNNQNPLQRTMLLAFELMDE